MFRSILFYLLGSILVGCNDRSNAAPRSDQPVRERIDSIVITKNLRLMQVFNSGRLLKSYHISLGNTPVGAKHFQNDGKTPEGVYHIDGKNPNSHYHKCLGISYPAPADVAYAKRHRKPTGGDIKIHGLPNGYGHLADEYVKEDWTLGCIALTDDEIDELYTHVAVGVCVNILP